MNTETHDDLEAGRAIATWVVAAFWAWVLVLILVAV
jgi:hypothetical protein